MNKTLTGRIFFGIGMLYLSILCFLSTDFIFGRPPIVTDLPILAYLLGGVIGLSAIAVLMNPKNGAAAALFMAVLILIFSFLIRYIPFFIRSFSVETVLWNINAYKTLALVGGSLIVSASFFQDREKDAPPFILNAGTVHSLKVTGIVLLSLFLIISGFAHFKFLDFVTGFIPAYIPFHGFFAPFTGVALIAGGVGLLLPPTRYWAALLTGCMLFSWFLLLHIPRFLADVNAQSDRLGLGESLAFAGILLVLAGMSEKTKG
jgi:uncharacterized membrane protein